MKNMKEKWIESVLSSTKGMRRAQPDVGLFDKISTAINLAQAKIIPMYYVKIAAAAAIILLVINIYAASNYSEQITNQMLEDSYASQETEQIFIDYNLYGS